MLGAIFGDIAGSVYEFNNIKTTNFDLLGRGTNYTDDSILTIAVADWLIDGSLNKERLAFTLCRYVKKYPHPMGSYGTRFIQWAQGDIYKPYNSWGNGSAMRVSPVGWAFDTLAETEEVAKLTAEVTHNHSEGIKGAQATAAAIFMARNLATKNEIKIYIETTYGYDLSRSCDQVRPTYQFNESCKGTVPEAIIAFLDSVDFESAIRLAVSLGGDSDTLTCITGGIAEAFYGMSYSLPETTETHHSEINFSEKALEKLPTDLSSIVKEFYNSFVNKNKQFCGKNESATIWGKTDWRECEFLDKVLNEESYKSFLKAYGPDWDMRFGVYYEDGWNYLYRSHFLLKKFRFQKKADGLYHLTELYATEKAYEDDILEEVLWHGYFEKPYSYKTKSIAFTPENDVLYKELEVLNIEFIDLYTQHKQMIESDSVILTSLYLEKLGHLQLELLKKQTESSRLKMKIKLIQAAYNRSEFPDLIAIEKILNDRLDNYYSQIQSQSAMLDESKKILSSLLSEEETLKLKEIFRVLCKKLHPDLNPHQSEDEKDLFIKVKAAYDLQRISDLQSILLYLDNFDNEKLIELSIDEKANRIEFLKKNIDLLYGKIEQLKNSFPFNVEELIYNEEQIAFKQEELKNQIKTFDEEIEKSTNTLKLMIDE